MGAGPARLSDEETKSKIEKFMKNLDEESGEIMHIDMKPMEVALLIILHRKHTEMITLHSSNRRWGWRKGLLQEDYKQRKNKIVNENKLMSQVQDSEKYADTVKKGLSDTDSIVFGSDEDRDDDNPEFGSDEERVEHYMKEQHIKVKEMDKNRLDEIFNMIKESPEAINEEESINDSLLKELDGVHEKYKSDIMECLTEQSRKLKDVLEKFHNDQKNIIKEADKRRIDAIERRNHPTSKELLDKIQEEKDPKLDESCRQFIDDLNNKIAHKKIKEEELKTCIADKIGSKKGRVEVNITENQNQANTEESAIFRGILARHVIDNPDSKTTSIYNKGIERNDAFNAKLAEVLEEEQ